MSKAQRFYFNKERYVVDRLDWLNNGLVWISDGWPDAIEDMQREIFRKRFKPLFESLLSPYVRKNRYGSYKARRYYDAESIIVTVAVAIVRGHTEHPTDKAQVRSRPGEVTGSTERMSNLTSVGLFVDELESLMQSIYGNFRKELSSRVREAVIGILQLVLRGPLKQVWREYYDACIVDGDLRIPGYSYKFDAINEAEAFDRIMAHAQKVRENPTQFGKYTIDFVKRLDATLKQDLQRNKPRSRKRPARDVAKTEIYCI
jgi:hypothetical protein